MVETMIIVFYFFGAIVTYLGGATYIAWHHSRGNFYHSYDEITLWTMVWPLVVVHLVLNLFASVAEIIGKPMNKFSQKFGKTVIDFWRK